MVEEHGLQLVVASSMRRTLATATGAFSSDVPMIGEKKSYRLRFLSCVCPEPVLANHRSTYQPSQKQNAVVCLTTLLSDGRAA
jgi:Pyruvate/2-oxoacid:ferredoxin oxidoreductase delta subunit